MRVVQAPTYPPWYLPSATPNHHQGLIVKRALLITVLVVLAVLGGAAIWFTLARNSPEAPPAAGSSPTSSNSSEERDAREAAAALRTLTDDPAALVPEDQRGTVSLSEAVPKGSHLSVDEDSWAPASTRSGTLVATLASPGQNDASYVVSMEREGGHWVVIGTIPVTG